MQRLLKFFRVPFIQNKCTKTNIFQIFTNIFIEIENYRLYTKVEFRIVVQLVQLFEKVHTNIIKLESVLCFKEELHKKNFHYHQCHKHLHLCLTQRQSKYQYCPAPLFYQQMETTIN